MGHVCDTVLHARFRVYRAFPRLGTFLPRRLRFVRTRRLLRHCPGLAPGRHRGTVYGRCNTIFVVNVKKGLDGNRRRSLHSPSCSSCDAMSRRAKLTKLGNSLLM